VARALLGHTKGSQLLEQTYDKPKPHELAARAGDLSGLAAEVAHLAESRKPTEKHGAFTGKTPEQARPWGPISSPTGGAPPSNARGNAAEAGQEPPSDGEDSRKPEHEETDLLAAIAEDGERAAAFDLATRPIRKAGGAPPEPAKGVG
jgi:hypothetical protein